MSAKLRLFTPKINFTQEMLGKQLTMWAGLSESSTFTVTQKHIDVQGGQPFAIRTEKNVIKFVIKDGFDIVFEGTHNLSIDVSFAVSDRLEQAQDVNVC
jgi:hypothetical protein